jgi:hypothetical protein
LLRAHKINKTVGICFIVGGKGWQSGGDLTSGGVLRMKGSGI